MNKKYLNLSYLIDKVIDLYKRETLFFMNYCSTFYLVYVILNTSYY